MRRAPSVDIFQYISQEWIFDETCIETMFLANSIQRWTREGRWLDMGCGPTLTIWPLFSDHLHEIYGCDRYDQVRTFHDWLIQSQRDNMSLPNCILNAIGLANRLRKHGSLEKILPLANVEGIIIDNILTLRTEWISTFENVVQVGCFGCLETKAGLLKATQNVHRYLKPGGVFISATWVTQPFYKESVIWGGANLTSYGPELYLETFLQAGLTLNEVKVVKLGSKEYREMVIVVCEKK